MTRRRVIWAGRADAPALAVACGSCNAGIGEPCKRLSAGQFHDARECVAEAVGFRWAREEPQGELL